MNIAHLLLGSAREFRDLPALARGTATNLDGEFATVVTTADLLR